MAKRGLGIGMLVMVLVFGIVVVGCDMGSINEEIQGKWFPEGGVSLGSRIFEFNNWTMATSMHMGFGVWTNVERIEIAIPRGSGQIRRAGVAFQAGDPPLYSYRQISDGVIQIRSGNSGAWITYNREITGLSAIHLFNNLLICGTQLIVCVEMLCNRFYIA